MCLPLFPTSFHIHSTSLLTSFKTSHKGDPLNILQLSVAFFSGLFISHQKPLVESPWPNTGPRRSSRWRDERRPGMAAELILDGFASCYFMFRLVSIATTTSERLVLLKLLWVDKEPIYAITCTIYIYILCRGRER